MKKVGLLGGSFDPPHRGHLYISLEAKKLFNLDELWWLVTPKNPLKINQPSTYAERVNNCRKIAKNYPIIIKEVEKKINSKYSFQTIQYIQNHYSKIKFYWLMGSDNLISFHKWQNWKKIFNQISIVIFRRHGYNNIALKSKTSQTLANYKINIDNFNKLKFSSFPSWTFVKNKEIKISSTEIREQREKFRR